jgi:uncharacterized protein YjdB
VTRFQGALLAALVAGCGTLPTTDDGVAFLDIIPPATLTVEVGDTLRFVARALDRDGQPIDVPVSWRTPDTTVSVDDSGLVTGLVAGTGRVQAAVGDSERLVSEFFSVTVKAPVAQAGPAR